MDLPSYFTWLGSNQLGVLSVIVIFWLVLVHAITVTSVKERILLKRTCVYVIRLAIIVADAAHSSEISLLQTFKREFRDIFANIFRLPRTIKQIVSVLLYVPSYQLSSHPSSSQSNSCQ